ncbi:hypothetical protein JOH52_004176 [Sinorhizobium meliloti]|nr:hypothetical protein [Sinorhizobium meliloti]TWB05418.1 hypothetical protein FB000_102182 [Ensifer sp. SEMIA 134]TWB41390.1 hypothetical protein FB001_101181 [Ensifer sp. SEMIA 135]
MLLNNRGDSEALQRPEPSLGSQSFHHRWK